MTCAGGKGPASFSIPRRERTTERSEVVRAPGNEVFALLDKTGTRRRPVAATGTGSGVRFPSITDSSRARDGATCGSAPVFLAPLVVSITGAFGEDSVPEPRTCPRVCTAIKELCSSCSPGGLRSVSAYCYRFREVIAINYSFQQGDYLWITRSSVNY